MRLSGTKTGSANQYNGLGDQLYDLGGARPTLDLNFANNGSLVDSVTGKTLVQHTRQSRATYVDGDGVIRQATTNLLPYSEDLASLFSPNNASINTNQAIAPNETLTADKFIPDATADRHTIQVALGTSLIQYTGSIYAKAGELTTITLRVGRALSYTEGVKINLTDGSIIYEGTGIDSAFVNDVGNGWYRISVTNTCTITGVQYFAVSHDDLDLTAGDNTSGIYIWGTQLEQSSTVGEYIPTTSTINSAPRFDHDPTTGESLGLLVEEARTNLTWNSGNFKATGWSDGTAGSFTTSALSAELAPNGGTAYEITETTDTNQHIYYNLGGATTNSTSVTSGTVYTCSVFLKPVSGGPDWMQITLGGSGFGSGQYANINITTGAVGSTAGLASGTAPRVDSFPNGWKRVSISVAATSTTTTNNIVIAFVNNNSAAARLPTYTGSTANKVLVALAQFEVGSFPTSYIPTTGAAAARAADAASISGSNFSSWYRQDEGTVFAEASPKSGAAFLGFNDGTTSNRIRLAHTGTSAASAVNVTGGVLQFSDTSGAASFPVNTQGKAALAMKASDFALVGNTSSVVTSTGLMPSANQATIGSSIGQAGAASNGPIARLTYWPQRLSNDTLQTITV
jgi:hypothetical protein